MPAIAQWVAARDPPHGKQYALAGAVACDRFKCIVGATRIEAALPADERTQQQLVRANAAKQGALREAGKISG